MEFLLPDQSCVWRVRGCGSGCGGAPVTVLVGAVLQPHCVHCALMFGMRLRLSLECWALQHRARHTAARTVPPEDGGWREAGKWAVAQSAGSPPPASHLHHTAQPTPCPAPWPPAAAWGRGRWPGAGAGAVTLCGVSSSIQPSPATALGPPRAASPAPPPPGAGWWQPGTRGTQPWTSMSRQQSSAVLAGLRGWGQARPPRHHHASICTVSPRCNAICKVWSSKMK